MTIMTFNDLEGYNLLVGVLFFGGKVEESVEGESDEPSQEVWVCERGGPVETEEGLFLVEEE